MTIVYPATTGITIQNKNMISDLITRGKNKSNMENTASLFSDYSGLLQIYQKTT